MQVDLDGMTTEILEGFKLAFGSERPGEEDKPHIRLSPNQLKMIIGVAHHRGVLFAADLTEEVAAEIEVKLISGDVLDKILPAKKIPIVLKGLAEEIRDLVKNAEYEGWGAR